MELDNIKAKLTVNDNIISGYAVIFDSVDLVGDVFTKDTYFGELDTLRPILMYEHGFDKTLKKLPIGITTDLIKDEIGVKFTAQLKVLNPKLWKELQIENSEEYLEQIKDLIKSKSLGVSSGAVGHAVVYDNEQKHIKQWPFGELSLTVRPAEPKTFIDNTKAGRVLSKKNINTLNKIKSSMNEAFNELNEILKDYNEEMLYTLETTKDVEPETIETNNKLDTKKLEYIITNKLKEFNND